MSNPDPERHPENLRPWPPGTSGNERGYSKGRRIADELVKLMEADERYARFASVGLARAMKGDFKFWRYIFDRLSPPETEARPADLEDVARAMQARRDRLRDQDDFDLSALVSEAEHRAAVRLAERAGNTESLLTIIEEASAEYGRTHPEPLIEGQPGGNPACGVAPPPQPTPRPTPTPRPAPPPPALPRQPSWDAVRMGDLYVEPRED